MEASSSSRVCCRIELLIAASLEPENITGFLYVRGCSATTLKTTCQNCLFDWGPPLAGGTEANKNPIILNLLRMEAWGQWSKLIMWCSCFSQNWITIMTQNWIGFPVLHQIYVASDFRESLEYMHKCMKWSDDDKNYYSPKYWMIHSQACKGRSSVNIGRFHDERNNNINKKSWSLNSPNS